MVYALILALVLVGGCAFNQNTGKDEVTVDGCLEYADLAHKGTIALVCPKLKTELDRLDCIDGADIALKATNIQCRRLATPEEDLELKIEDPPPEPVRRRVGP